MADNPNKARTEINEKALMFIKRLGTNKEKWRRFFEALELIERALMRKAIEEALRRRRDGELPEDETLFSQVMRIRRRGPDLGFKSARLEREEEAGGG